MCSPMSANATIVVAFRRDLLGREAEQRRREIDVRVSGVVGMEARAELEQRGNASVDDAPCLASA